MRRMKGNALDEAVKKGTLPERLDEYIASCRPPPDADPKKKSGKMPNLAGFCAFLHCGIRSAKKLRLTQPELYDRICTVLEDEALNSSLSPALLAHYLKTRLSFEEDSEEGSDADCGKLQLIFEHDIVGDGE